MSTFKEDDGPGPAGPQGPAGGKGRRAAGTPGNAVPLVNGAGAAGRVDQFLPRRSHPPDGYLAGFAALGLFHQVSQSHYIEGTRWARLNWGRAAAQPVTFAFWALGTIPGTATLSVRNADNTRSYASNFTINVANTWEFKTVTVPGCLDGTWQTGPLLGAALGWCYASGTNYQLANNTWTSALGFATAATTNFFVTAGNKVSITGITILPGSEAPSQAGHPLIFRPVDVERPLVERFYRQVAWTLEGYTSIRVDAMSAMPPMRSVPSVT
jgi:hypothetical protein